MVSAWFRLSKPINLIEKNGNFGFHFPYFWCQTTKYCNIIQLHCKVDFAQKYALHFPLIVIHWCSFEHKKLFLDQFIQWKHIATFYHHIGDMDPDVDSLSFCSNDLTTVFILDGCSFHVANEWWKQGLFPKKNIGFDDSFDVTKCLQQIEQHDLLHVCA